MRMILDLAIELIRTTRDYLAERKEEKIESVPLPSLVKLRGEFTEGYALDFHTWNFGDDFERTLTAELLWKYKYRRKKKLSQPLGKALAEFIRKHPNFSQVDFVIPAPSTKKGRPFDPVGLLAKVVSENIGLKLGKRLVRKVRQTQLQKELKTKEEKIANI